MVPSIMVEITINLQHLFMRSIGVDQNNSTDNHHHPQNFAILGIVGTQNIQTQ